MCPPIRRDIARIASSFIASLALAFLFLTFQVNIDFSYQLEADFATGPLDHQVMLGLDYQRFRNNLWDASAAASSLNPYTGVSGGAALTNLTHTDARTDDNFSGRAALLYHFANGFSPYASYSTAVTPEALADQNGHMLKPSSSEQYEVGLKYQAPGSASVYSVALYDLTRRMSPTAWCSKAITFPPVKCILRALSWKRAARSPIALT